MHEKGSQGQNSDGTLFNSQERRAAVVPVINGGSTVRCVPPSVYIGFPLFVLPGGRSKQLFRCSGGKRDGCVLGGPTRRRPVLPGRAPPRRPALRRPESFRQWYVRVLDSTLDDSKTRTYHGRSGSARRTAGRRGAAGPGRTGCRRVGRPRSQASL